MPAVTVEDTLVLPRVTEPDAGTAAERPVRTVTTAQVPAEPHPGHDVL